VTIHVDARLRGGFERFSAQRTDFVQRASIGVATNDGERFTRSNASKLHFLCPIPRSGKGGVKRGVRNPTVLNGDEIVRTCGTKTELTFFVDRATKTSSRCPWRNTWIDEHHVALDARDAS
jgi:hypothetical protein